MKKIFRTLYDLMTDEMARGRHISVLFRFISLQIRFLFKTEYEFEWLEGLKIRAIRHWPGTTECYYYGKYDRSELTFLERYMDENMVLLDIGANIGSYSLYAVKKTGCKAIAVEPEPKTYAELKNNIDINLLNDYITAFNCAVGDVTGRVRFTNNLDMSNHIVEDQDESGENIIEVECRRLDDFITTGDVLKLDVEGVEALALCGSERLLSYNRLKVLIVEVIYNIEEIEAEIFKYGYKRCKYDYINNRLISSDEESFERKGDNFFYVKDIDSVKKRVGKKV